MTLIIDNPHVEKLVDELVEITGESPTDVVRKALLERKERVLEEEIWPSLPEDERGRMPYGPHGV